MSADPFELAAEFWQRPDYTLDVVRWAHDRLGIDLWSKQVQIVTDPARRVLVRSCHDSGKTFVAGIKALHHIDTHPIGQARVVSTAPTEAQVKALLWMEMRSLFRRAEELGHPLPGYMLETEWKVDGWQAAVGRKPGDYDQSHMQGYHCLFPLVIVDEADGIPSALWNALETLMTNDNARMFCVGNPDDPGSYFKGMQDLATEAGLSSGSSVHVIKARDTPNFSGEPVSEYVQAVLLSKQWVTERRLMWGGPAAINSDILAPVDHPFWISKVEAEYPGESELTVISAGDLAACQLLDLPDQSHAPVQLGIDMASSETGDELVIRERRGPHALRRWGTHEADPERIQAFIEAAILESGASKVVVDVTGGLGLGFVGALRAHPKFKSRVAFVEFNFGAGARDKEHFRNARAELWWKGRELARDRKWDLSRMEYAEVTIAQLASARRRTGTEGQPLRLIQVEDKHDIRRRIGSSPDDADAMLMAYWTGGGGQMHVTGASRHTLPTGAAALVRPR